MDSGGLYINNFGECVCMVGYTWGLGVCVLVSIYTLSLWACVGYVFWGLFCRRNWLFNGFPVCT